MELELVNTEADANASFNSSADYTKLSPLGKIPAFEGANGFALSEAIAIAVYGMCYACNTLRLCFRPSFMMRCIISTSYPWQNYTVEKLPTLKPLYPTSGRFFCNPALV